MLSDSLQALDTVFFFGVCMQRGLPWLCSGHPSSSFMETTLEVASASFLSPWRGEGCPQGPAGLSPGSAEFSLQCDCGIWGFPAADTFRLHGCPSFWQQSDLLGAVHISASSSPPGMGIFIPLANAEHSCGFVQAVRGTGGSSIPCDGVGTFLGTGASPT